MGGLLIVWLAGTPNPHGVQESVVQYLEKPYTETFFLLDSSQIPPYFQRKYWRGLYSFNAGATSALLLVANYANFYSIWAQGKGWKGQELRSRKD